MVGSSSCYLLPVRHLAADLPMVVIGVAARHEPKRIDFCSMTVSLVRSRGDLPANSGRTQQRKLANVTFPAHAAIRAIPDTTYRLLQADDGDVLRRGEWILENT